mmetsp:Transcript_50939/g.120575  ORF Transcript_50939/g.120575 Transcript_50939/m.120575 type:complete len:116 (+) Transcript_50939:312-659(+)
MYDSSCVDGTDCLFNSSNVGLKDAAVVIRNSNLKALCRHVRIHQEPLLEVFLRTNFFHSSGYDTDGEHDHTPRHIVFIQGIEARYHVRQALCNTKVGGILRTRKHSKTSVQDLRR